MRDLVIFFLCFATWCTSNAQNHSTYLFYRDLGQITGGEMKVARYKVHGFKSIRSGADYTRRIFGGEMAKLGDYPAACALLDRYFSARCSASVLASHWALTAAHCVSPEVSYIKYNTRLSASDEGDVVAVHYLYRHPEFRVLQEDVGNGMDVTLLHHDIGLIRTRDEIKLSVPLPHDPLANIRRYDPMNLINENVQVFGFGLTENTSVGEELCGARLRLVACGRSLWYHVVCGVGGTERGVCSGDSGGPVVFAGAQVAVTSMGPRSCAHLYTPGVDAVSVFTTLRPYLDLLNATMADTDQALRMHLIANGPAPPLTLNIHLGNALLLHALISQH